MAILTKEPPSRPKKKSKIVPTGQFRDKKKGLGSIGSKTRETVIDVKALCKRFDLTRVELSRLASYSLRSVDKWAAGEKPNSAAQKRLTELARLLGALAEIMESKYVGEWLKTPNDAFDGSTPLQVVERSESDLIWRMVYEIQTGAFA